MDNLDLEVPEGSLYGFLGPNGAGKTTTIRMALGIIFPSEGSVEVLGEPVRAGAPVFRSVGALIEEPAFWPYLSGRKNLEYLARSAGPRADRDARLQRIDEVLALVDLDAGANKKVKAYSQGMRQRLGIASALLGAPRILLLDEPTNGLDPGGMRQIRTLLRRLASEGTTVFVSSHLLFEVEAMCDRVAVLAHGKLVAEGAPSELRRASDRVLIDVDDRPRAEKVLASLDGVSVDADTVGPLRVRFSEPMSAASINAALVNAGVGVHALRPEQDSLEDAFVHLVEGEETPR